MKNTIKIIIILVFLLVIAIGYIVIDTYKGVKEKEQMEIYQELVQYGYDVAIFEIIQQAVTCQQVTLKIENQTINIINIDCLQQK